MWTSSDAAAEGLTAEGLTQAAEGLTLLKANNKTGYFGVNHLPGRSKPYQAQLRRGGKQVYLGSFVTAEEAALCIARTPEGRLATDKAAALPAGVPPPPPSSSAADGLMMLMSAAGAAHPMSVAEKPSSSGTGIEEKQEEDVQRAAGKRPRGSDSPTVKTAKVFTHFKRDRQYFAETRGR